MPETKDAVNCLLVANHQCVSDAVIVDSFAMRLGNAGTISRQSYYFQSLKLFIVVFSQTGKFQVPDWFDSIYILYFRLHTLHGKEWFEVCPVVRSVLASTRTDLCQKGRLVHTSFLTFDNNTLICIFFWLV